MKIVTGMVGRAIRQLQNNRAPGCALSSTLFNYIIGWFLGQAFKGYPGFQVGTNVHASALSYADGIVLLNNNYREMQDLLESVNRHAAVSRRKLMPTLNPHEERQAVLLDGEPLEDAYKFKYLGSRFIASGQGTKQIRNRVNLARPAFSHLKFCLL